MDRRRILFGVGFFMLVSIACAGQETHQEERSTVLIVGGEKSLESQYPSVIKMVVDEDPTSGAQKICTGVVITHRTVVAASHCIKRAQQSGENNFKFVKVASPANRARLPRSVMQVYTYDEPLSLDMIPENYIPLDLAVLDFGQNAFHLPTYPKLAKKTPQAGESVTLVGFGATSFRSDGGSPGEQRFGKNRLETYDATKGVIYVTGDTDGTQGALAAPGDSGGPLFNRDGELLGIGSALLIEGEQVTNFFVDLTSRTSRILLERYLSDFGSDAESLLPGFGIGLSREFSNVKAVSLAQPRELVAMCGGDKGSDDKSSANQGFNGQLNSAGSGGPLDFGNGLGLPGSSGGGGGSGRSILDAADAVGARTRSVEERANRDAQTSSASQRSPGVTTPSRE